MSVKAIIKRLCPTKIWDSLHKMRYIYGQKRVARESQQRNKQVLSRLQNKQGTITVLFMATYGPSWKYDSVYQLMIKDSLFNPIILVCPVVNRGREHMIETMDECCEFFKHCGYTFIKAYDEKTDSYIDAHSLDPDIIFFTSPYKGLIDDKYYIDAFPNALSCYINYAYNNHVHEWGFNLPFHQSLWRYYLECELNYQLVKKTSAIKANNCVVTGYPMYDAFVEGTKAGNDWKLKDTKHKRLIWSPHHSIDGFDDDIKYSTFLLYSEFMVEMAKKYKDTIEIVFKPHPLLKVNLYQHPDWGKERTDAYYDAWKNGKNTAIDEGEYIDLFNSSDAMINDSGSFTIEYLYMNKPCLFLNNYNRQNDANEVSLRAIDCWYHATADADIEKFISDVVIAGNDTMKEKRKTFYHEVLLPPNGCSVAENIINDIKNAVNN